MPSLLESLPQGARVDVIRLRSLGDCVLTTPALALLKAHRPDLRINILVEQRFVGVFEGSTDVEEISIDLRPLNRRGALLVLNLHGGPRSMLMVLLSGAKYRAGFAHHRYSHFYSHRIPRAQEILGEHTTFPEDGYRGDYIRELAGKIDKGNKGVSHNAGITWVHGLGGKVQNFSKTIQVSEASEMTFFALMCVAEMVSLLGY